MRDGTLRAAAARGSAPFYEPLGSVLVRAPLLPVEAYLALPDDARQSLANPLVRCAVSVGSPDLLAQSDRPGSPRREQRMLRKLERYAIRMSTRPTPYGMFAGVALAELDVATTLRLAPQMVRTQMRPDMAWLLAFVAQLEKRREIRCQLRVVANPEVVVIGGRAGLARRSALDGADVRPVAVRATPAVRRVLEQSGDAVQWSRLASDLLSLSGATADKVERLLTDLWEESFLLTTLRPPLTHPSPAHYVADCLADVPAAHQERELLLELLEAMAQWDDLEVGQRPRAGADITRRAMLAVPGHGGTCTQVDTALRLSSHQVAAPVARAAARAAEVLVRLGPPAGDNLAAYRNAFVNRYGTGREVGLLELLDPDRGLGPPAVHRAPSHSHPSTAGVLRDATLRSLAINAARDRRLAVQLDPPTLDRLARWTPTPGTAPLSVDLAVFVLATSTADIDAGNFRLLIGPNLGAQAAGRNLGRFAHLLGDEATAVLAAVAKTETRHAPADVHAELVYLPRIGRGANVAVRPATRDYEVAVETTPGVDGQHAIPVSELLVGLRGAQFYVRWPGLAGDLRVHAGHMLNPRGAPEACRFLEDVARGPRTVLAPFSWGPVADLPFLPRVEVDQMVLAPAQWRIDAASRGDLLDAGGSAFLAQLAQWRSRWMVPRHVYLAQGDNRLLLDLEAPAQARQLQDELEGSLDKTVVLQEALPAPEHAWLEGPDGHHLCELVVPLVQPVPVTIFPAMDVARTGPVAVVVERSDRVRPPGSEWLYVKLYGPRDGEDDLLRGPVSELGQLATLSGLAEEWFFLRYADPDPHLRIRFRGDPGVLWRDLLPRVSAMAAALIEDGRCLRMVIDTYDREIERYGGLGAIAIAESVFAADSEAVVSLLGLGGLPTLDPTTLAVLGVDALLDGLGVPVAGRLAWYRTRPNTRSASSAEHRLRQGRLRRLLGHPDALSNEPGGALVCEVLAHRSLALAPLGVRLQVDESLLASLVHMHCNRLLGAGTPLEKTVLGLLLRTHEGLSRSPYAP